MIDPHTLQLVHYCHENCTPLKNILRLPREEAFRAAQKLADENPNTTAFFRFGDFVNYYPLRMRADARLRERFVQLGGRPKEEHALFFVLQGSDYLHQWFGNGKVITIPLDRIPAEAVSFTEGDSTAVFDRTGDIQPFTKDVLYRRFAEWTGTLDGFMADVHTRCHYIEVQLWDDDYLPKIQ